MLEKLISYLLGLNKNIECAPNTKYALNSKKLSYKYVTRGESVWKMLV